MKKIQLNIDPRLIAKLPEMFGGNDQALRELLQNAYRAGAKNVRAEWRSADKTLTIEDDGKGEADPRNVFYPGRTGWNEQAVRSPAGLGLYALLTEETESIEFVTRPRSGRGWTARFRKDDLEKKCIEVHEGRNLRPGTRVQISYRKNPWKDMKEALERDRGLYPYRLTLTADGNEIEIPARRVPGDKDAKRDFQTQVGEVVLRKDCWREETCEAVWECQIIQSKALKEAIEEAVRKHPESEVAAGLFGMSSYGMRWIINPDCNVRPRLPDRSDLIGGMALESAAYQIVNAVVEEVLAWAEEWKRNWPESIRIRKIDERKLADGWADQDLVIRLMQRAGWRTVRWPEEDGIDIECGSDGEVSFWPEYKEALAKNPIEVGSQALANAINRAGKGKIYAQAVDPVARPPMKNVEIDGLQLDTVCRIGLAKRIHFDGIGEMPYLANEADEENWEGIPQLEGSEALLIFAGGPDEFLAKLDGNLLRLIAMLSYERNTEEGYTYQISGELAGIHEDRLREILIGEITRAFKKDKLEECRRYYALEKAVSVGETIAISLEDLDRKTGKIGADNAYSPEISKLQEGIHALLGMLRKDKSAAGKTSGLENILNHVEVKT